MKMNKQPNPENSIDKREYPEGSTFEYDPKTPVNTTKPGDYTVNVIVKIKRVILLQKSLQLYVW